jgi:hypothetical protein
MTDGEPAPPPNWAWNRRCVRAADSGFTPSKTPDPFSALGVIQLAGRSAGHWLTGSLPDRLDRADKPR